MKDTRVRDRLGRFRRANSNFNGNPSRQDARPQSGRFRRTDKEVDSDPDLQGEIDALVREKLRREFIECPECQVLFLQEDGIKHCGYVYDIETDDWGKCSEEEDGDALSGLLEEVDEEESPVEKRPPPAVQAVQVKTITVSDEPYVDVKGYTAELRDSTRRKVIEGAIEGDKVLLSNLPIGEYSAERALQKGEGHVRVIRIVKVEKKPEEVKPKGGFLSRFFGDDDD